ncbi:Serine/threonine-protein kinase [Ceratobasidium sp. 423]|nr:Serine/threonine-protein kinase [Ceratobasidium sp. 423]
MNSAPSPPFDDAGAHPYIILNRVGRGSFGTVHRGRHSKTHQVVAIKVISYSNSTTNPKLLSNLQSEIDILKKLKDKHITRLHEVIKAPGNVYLIMEFCSGGDLSAYIKHRGRIAALHTPTSPMPTYLSHPKVGGLSKLVVSSFVGQLSSAMKFLRVRDLIHRDLKPQNLLLSPANSAEEYACAGKGGWIPGPIGTPILKVGDFGFARALPNGDMAETLCGSPLYMAPEILRLETYSPNVDLWSIGVITYELAVGEPPFKARNPMSLLKEINDTGHHIHFPDEDSKHANAISRGDLEPVSKEVKSVIRSLLKPQSVERLSFDGFFAAAEEIVRPAMEPELNIRTELADATVGGGVGEGADRAGDSNGSEGLKVKYRALWQAPCPPPKSAVEKPTKPVKRSTSPTRGGGTESGFRKMRGDTGVGAAGRTINVGALMPPITPIFRRTIEPKDGKMVGETQLPPLGLEETLHQLEPLPVPEDEEEYEDGDLKGEYVLVDGGVDLEFNRMVDDSLNRANNCSKPSPASTHTTSLVRVFGLASKKLFGTGERSRSGLSNGPIEGSPSEQRCQASPCTAIERRPNEHIICTLEVLAQKARAIQVLADSNYDDIASRSNTKPTACPVGFELDGAETRPGVVEFNVVLATKITAGLYLAVMNFAIGASTIARAFLDGGKEIGFAGIVQEGELKLSPFGPRAERTGNSTGMV